MFGKRLKKLRKNSGYSMDTLIKLYNKKYNAKMNKSTLSRYENGLQEPIYTVVVNLANFFNVTTDYLLTGDTSKIKENNDTQTTPTGSSLDMELTALTANLINSDDEWTKQFIVKFLKLSPKSREMFKKMLSEISTDS